MIKKPVKYAPKSMENYLMKRMLAEKANGYLKKGTFTDELIWGKYSYLFSNQNKTKNKSFKAGLFLFGMVRKDAKLFLKTNPKIKLPKKHNQIEYSEYNNVDEKITGTDLNHAYWRIAYNLKIISPNTYNRGLNNDYKSIRLAALSTLGADKKYKIIKNGELTDDYKIIKGILDLQMVYKLIRYTCYLYMNKVKKILGNDFIAYKTDAVYYRDTKDNRKKVRDFLKEKDLFMKQLE